MVERKSFKPFELGVNSSGRKGAGRDGDLILLENNNIPELPEDIVSEGLYSSNYIKANDAYQSRCAGACEKCKLYEQVDATCTKMIPNEDGTFAYTATVFVRTYVKGGDLSRALSSAPCKARV